MWLRAGVFAIHFEHMGKEHRVASPAVLLMARASSRPTQTRATPAAPSRFVVANYVSESPSNAKAAAGAGREPASDSDALLQPKAASAWSVFFSK